MEAYCDLCYRGVERVIRFCNHWCCVKCLQTAINNLKAATVSINEEIYITDVENE